MVRTLAACLCVTCCMPYRYAQGHAKGRAQKVHHPAQEASAGRGLGGGLIDLWCIRLYDSTHLTSSTYNVNYRKSPKLPWLASTTACSFTAHHCAGSTCLPAAGHRAIRGAKFNQSQYVAPLLPAPNRRWKSQHHLVNSIENGCFWTNLCCGRCGSWMLAKHTSPASLQGTYHEAIQNKDTPFALAPAWKMLLLSDGSVTRHLQLLTGRDVSVVWPTRFHHMHHQLMYRIVPRWRAWVDRSAATPLLWSC